MIVVIKYDYDSFKRSVQFYNIKYISEKKNVYWWSDWPSAEGWTETKFRWFRNVKVYEVFDFRTIFIDTEREREWKKWEQKMMKTNEENKTKSKQTQENEIRKLVYERPRDASATFFILKDERKQGLFIFEGAAGGDIKSFGDGRPFCGTSRRINEEDRWRRNCSKRKLGISWKGEGKFLRFNIMIKKMIYYIKISVM